MGSTLHAYLTRVVKAVANVAPQLPRRHLVLVAGHRGSLASRRVLIVGRAPHGWHTSFNPQQLRRRADVLRVVDRALEEVDASSGCPMRWVADQFGVSKRGVFNTKSSSFWRLGRLVALDTCCVQRNFDLTWSSHLMWTNLYKVAPFAGRNPSTRLSSAIHDGSVAVFAEELRRWRPRVIVFATGWNWAEVFVTQLASTNSITVCRQRRYLQAHGRLSCGSQFVVVRHPERKPLARIMEAVRQGLKLGRSAESTDGADLCGWREAEVGSIPCCRRDNERPDDL